MRQPRRLSVSGKRSDRFEVVLCRFLERKQRKELQNRLNIGCDIFRSVGDAGLYCRVSAALRKEKI